jgi:hypothetical protein
LIDAALTLAYAGRADSLPVGKSVAELFTSAQKENPTS